MASHDKLWAKRDTVRIGVVAVDRGLAVAVDGLADVFAVATQWWSALAGSRAGRFETTILGAHASLHTFTGRPLAIDATLDEWPGKAGGDIVICSATADPNAVIGDSDAVVGWLRKTAKRPRITVASVCTGAFFLAEAGLLDGLRATTNPLYARTFARRYTHVRLELSRVIVDEGQRVTAGTVSAGLNLALHFVEKYAGVEVASVTAKSFAVDKNRESQSPYLIPPRRLDAGDELAVRAQRWIEEHHADPDVTLAAIASANAVGVRTLQRHLVAATGDGPLDYLRRVRLEAAKRLLETTEDTVDRISWRVGYRDARSFARLFGSYVDLTPSAYRERFGIVPNGKRRARSAL
jgi:transcriptional regulator GlxA family with amidase domain